MRSAVVAFVVGFAFLANVMAGPRKVLVLPVDGTTDTTQRMVINGEMVKLAKAGVDGDVTAGDTTFNDTATAVGCNPDAPECAQTVLATLSVDELVYGTASTDGGTTTVTVYRITKGEPPRSQSATIEETTNGGLQPLFAREDVVEAGSGSGSQTVERPPPRTFFDSRERKMGVGFAAGGVACLIVGLSLWAGASDLQEQIDGHPTTTLAQLQSLNDLEDRAAGKALWGNLFVLAGLGLTATGAYYLYTDHKSRSAIVTPAPTEDGTGAKLLIGGRW